MTDVTLAVAPQWFQDRDLIQLYFLGMLYRSMKRRDFRIEFAETNDYGALGLIRCEPDADRSECQIAVERLSDAMALRDRNDPFAEAREFWKQDREDRERIEKLIDEFLREESR